MISPYQKRLPDGSPRKDPNAAYPDLNGKHFQIDAARLMGYALLLERHLEYLKKRCAGCPYRNYGVDGYHCPESQKKSFYTSKQKQETTCTGSSDSHSFLDDWFYEEQVWAANYVHKLERRLYDLKQGCNQCPYRDQEGSGCHDEISD